MDYIFTLLAMLTAAVMLPHSRALSLNHAPRSNRHSSSRQMSSSPLFQQLQHLFQGDTSQYQFTADQLVKQKDHGNQPIYPQSFQPYLEDGLQLLNGQISPGVGDSETLQRFEEVISGLEDLASVVPAGEISPIDQQQPPDRSTEASNVPIIDPGLFVIQGVRTCGNQSGYCMLGSNCTTDTDFLEDADGHCRGLRSAFSPPADFICCKFNPDGRKLAFRTTPTTTEGVTLDDGLEGSIVNFEEHGKPHEIDENSHLVDIVAIITDSTGIVDFVTRPYEGEWPPKEQEYGQGITLPFAKPGETFDPDSLAGLNSVSDSLTTTPSSTTTENYSNGDLLDNPLIGDLKEEESRIEARVTLSPVTKRPIEADVENESFVDELLSVREQADGLGALALVPVMSHDQDYIGEVDYESHLQPALLPKRPDFSGLSYQELSISPDEESSGYHEEDLMTSDHRISSQKNDLDNKDNELSVESEEFHETSENGPSETNVSLITSSDVDASTCGVMGSTLANLLSRTHYTSRHLGRGRQTSLVANATFDGAVLESPVALVTSTVVWCWMAAVMQRSRNPDRPLELVCTGTLVQQDLVLTSASCGSRLKKQKLEDFVILLGASTLHSGVDFGTQRIELGDVVVHEEYRMNDGVHYNDVGIIKLKRAAVSSRTVCRLCLPPENMELETRQSCTATGYGLKAELRTFRQDPSPEKAGILRQITLPIVPSTQCSAVQELSSRDPHLDVQSFICAAQKLSPDVCLMIEDDGSPVACMAPSGRYYLYGLISSDYDCHGQHPRARIYTNVAKYFSWINSNYKRMAGDHKR